MTSITNTTNARGQTRDRMCQMSLIENINITTVHVFLVRGVGNKHKAAGSIFPANLRLETKSEFGGPNWNFYISFNFRHSNLSRTLSDTSLATHADLRYNPLNFQNENSTWKRMIIKSTELMIKLIYDKLNNIYTFLYITIHLYLVRLSPIPTWYVIKYHQFLNHVANTSDFNSPIYTSLFYFFF